MNRSLIAVAGSALLAAGCAGTPEQQEVSAVA